ncbi:hypothetical protein LAT59_00770 [Candidatus Gracilibacteria bacterium]|nr:hypothetical protein [Candidatus Gracilibacteria bacterium]
MSIELYDNGGSDDSHVNFTGDASIKDDVSGILGLNDNAIIAKQKIHSLPRTKESALKLVEICEILRYKCMELGIDYTPPDLNLTGVNNWMNKLYVIYPWDTKSMKQINVLGEKRRVKGVFMWKIQHYKKFANHMIHLLNNLGVSDFDINI